MPGGLEVVVDLGAVVVRQLGYRFDLHDDLLPAYISGTASGSPDPYSYVTCTTDSLFETDSGADTTTLDEVDSFSFAADSSDAYEYTITGPPSSTITDESTTSASDSGGTLENPSNGTLIPAYWDTYAIGLAAKMGTSPLDAPIQDGTTSGEWDTSQGLVSALGGQDMHALQFTGAEVQPALSGSAIVLEQGVDATGTWTSHPSAIGYRRQGHVTGGSHGGSGSATITIMAVAPEFDSGMNQGTDQDEMERLENFSQGAQENPTVAQSQPTSRAAQQTAVVGPGGEPLFTPEGPTTSNVGNSMNVGGYTGYALVQQFAWILGPLGFLPPGFGAGGAGGGGQGGSGGPMKGASPFSNRMYALSPGSSPGNTAQGPPPLWDDPNHVPGPGRYSTANETDPSSTGAASPVLGSQINSGKPAPETSERADDPPDDEDAVQNACDGDGDGGTGAQGSNPAPQPGGYPGGWYNPLNWYRGVYTRKSQHA